MVSPMMLPDYSTIDCPRCGKAWILYYTTDDNYTILYVKLEPQCKCLEDKDD